MRARPTTRVARRIRPGLRSAVSAKALHGSGGAPGGLVDGSFGFRRREPLSSLSSLTAAPVLSPSGLSLSGLPSVGLSLPGLPSASFPSADPSPAGLSPAGLSPASLSPASLSPASLSPASSFPVG